MVGALSAPQIPAPQPNPFEQAVIAGAQAAKQHGHEPPKTSITISTPTPSGPNATGAIPMPKPPAAPQFSQAPIPGAAGGPGQPTGPVVPQTAVDPAALAAQAQQQRDAAQAARGTLATIAAQPPPAPTPYAQPAMPKAPPGQDLGNLLGALLFRQAGPAFAKQANAQLAQREKQHAEDIAAAKETATGSYQSAQLAEQARRDAMQAQESIATGDEAGAKAATDEAIRQQQLAEKSREADIKFGQEATKIADNRTKFATTFSLGLANLGFKESQFTTKEADALAYQAANLTAKYYGYGLRADTAYTVAQLRTAAQMVISDGRIAAASARTDAVDATRVAIAKDQDVQRAARSALQYITDWEKSIPDPAKRATAMEAALKDQSSVLSQAMGTLKRSGVFGTSVGAEVRADIDASTQQAGTTGGTVINQTFNQGPAAAAPPVAPAPPVLPPGAKIGTIHTNHGDVQGYTVDGKTFFTMDGKPV